MQADPDYRDRSDVDLALLRESEPRRASQTANQQPAKKNADADVEPKAKPLHVERPKRKRLITENRFTEARFTYRWSHPCW